ncbi:MAG: undecaprenyl/decaprenyl-phosphate alpha-N-acetylglucosaminyl 1-phosphate transferase [Nocardioidaceae bacterium]|nr:undecaprenyl/decaprenyl-phosphate alpha-N-acetylglucosaminyl 1-phosphate transferase [Nocardioidaceae bacterium]
MRQYILIGLVALAVTYLLAVVARELAMKFGAYARVRDRDVHEIPIPYFGGVAIMGGLTAAYLVASKLPFASNSSGDQILSDARAILVGGAIVCLVGVMDDIFELDALTKFAGEVIAAAVVVVQGVQILWLPLPGEGSVSTFSMDASQAGLITVLLIVGTVNAVNFVDGLDGLAAGVVGIGAVAFFTYAVLLVFINDGIQGASTAAILTAALAGACFGFLPHNFFPARMFMGDSGALLIGFMLACSAISLTGQYPTSRIAEGAFGATASLLPALLPLILPFAVLVVPFVDMLLAIVRRTRAGRSPFSPDKGHLHHRLLEIGHSQRRAVLVMYLWAGLVAFGVVVMSLFSGWWSALGITAMGMTALLLTFGLPGHSGIIKPEDA